MLLDNSEICCLKLIKILKFIIIKYILLLRNILNFLYDFIFYIYKIKINGKFQFEKM